MKTVLVAVIALQAWPVSAEPFRNLGFDEANTNRVIFFHPSDPSAPFAQGVGPAEDLVPGWQLLIGRNPVQSVGWNLVTNVSNFSVYSQDLLPGKVEGAYALHILYDNSGPAVTMLVQQRGDIPADARILNFRHDAEFLVTADGTRLFPPVPPPVPTEQYTSLDISAFAGKKMWSLLLGMAGELGLMDSIAFSRCLELGSRVTSAMRRITSCSYWFRCAVKQSSQTRSSRTGKESAAFRSTAMC